MNNVNHISRAQMYTLHASYTFSKSRKNEIHRDNCCYLKVEYSIKEILF